MSMSKTDGYRIFEGPNGWYVAQEDANGFHHQPSDGGRLSRAEAREALDSILIARDAYGDDDTFDGPAGL